LKFRHYDQGHEAVAQKPTEVVDRFMGNLVDAEAEAMVPVFGNQFALLRWTFLIR
jgi:hypothetical protein